MTSMRKRPLKRLLCVYLILISLLSLDAFAHPGRTDANGGHYNRSDGTYHFHNGEYVGKQQSYTTNTSLMQPQIKTSGSSEQENSNDDNPHNTNANEYIEVIIITLIFNGLVSPPILAILFDRFIKPFFNLFNISINTSLFIHNAFLQALTTIGILILLQNMTFN